MKIIKILSDYSPVDSPNILKIVYDDQGDVHISIYESQENDGVRIASSGTFHHSAKIQKAFWELIKAYEEELANEYCHPDSQDLNK